MAHNIIPKSSNIYQELKEIGQTKKIVIFSGLPGVGKSLYIQEFQKIVSELEKPIDVIQWDVARKSFESDSISKDFPMGEGTVHNGVKIMAGLWLMDTISTWINANIDNSRILLIEAPLVGHRFVELVHKVDDDKLEEYLSGHKAVVVMPIPTKEVRATIEQARKDQVDENAKVWSGAKPSVMLMLWKMTCGIANEFGMDIDLSEQPPYSPGIYEFVFGEILKHRNFVPLMIDEIFDIPEQEESALHNDNGMKADDTLAIQYAEKVKEGFSDEDIDEIVNKWYLT